MQVSQTYGQNANSGAGPFDDPKQKYRKHQTDDAAARGGIMFVGRQSQSDVSESLSHVFYKNQVNQTNQTIPEGSSFTGQTPLSKSDVSPSMYNDIKNYA